MDCVVGKLESFNDVSKIQILLKAAENLFSFSMSAFHYPDLHHLESN